MLARFAGFLPFATAARELEAVCGIAVSAKTVQRQSQAVGQQIAREWEPQAAARPSQLHLTCDGVMVHAGGQWREVKIGCAYERADTEGVTKASDAAVLASSRAFGKRLRTLGHEAGADNCRNVGIVADGLELSLLAVSRWELYGCSYVSFGRKSKMQSIGARSSESMNNQNDLRHPHFVHWHAHCCIFRDPS